MLKRIQHDLFDLGADLATPYKKSPDKALRIIESQVTRLEKEIDGLNARLSPLNSFVLPGGTDLAATLHFVRTITRCPGLRRGLFPSLIPPPSFPILRR